MSPDELRQIETALGIELPAPYKRLMSPFPVHYLGGNTDTDLWDNASALIERNQELRADQYRRWPQNWLFIGDPLTSCGNAIDLRHSSAPVVWVDHCDLRTVEGVKGTAFEDWFSRWLTDVRSDLARDGFYPDSEPPPPYQKPPIWFGKYVLTIGIVIIVISSIVGGIMLIRDLVRWLISKA
jgi:hypothetical protein